MGDQAWKMSLLLLLKRALDKALEKGIAVSLAAVKRDDKYEYRHNYTDWDHRCRNCLEGNDDEENERARP